MEVSKINLVTEIIGPDEFHTYEIKKTWDEKRKKGLVIEIYPTVSITNVMNSDLSTLHLMNHVKDFNWGNVRIVNLYSTVYNSKPLVKTLDTDTSNIKYILNILSSPDIAEYDIVVAWGSSLASNKKTIERKLVLLSAMKEKKLSKQVKYIEAEGMDKNVPAGAHPLFLGLHYAKEQWKLRTYPVTDKVAELKKKLKTKGVKEKKKREEKAGEENVSKDNE